MARQGPDPRERYERGIQFGPYRSVAPRGAASTRSPARSSSDSQATLARRWRLQGAAASSVGRVPGASATLARDGQCRRTTPEDPRLPLFVAPDGWAGELLRGTSKWASSELRLRCRVSVGGRP